jgi:hypothetical protein
LRGDFEVINRSWPQIAAEVVTGAYPQAGRRFDFPVPASAQAPPTKTSCHLDCVQLQQGGGIHQPAAEIRPYSRFLQQFLTRTSAQ